MTRSGPTPGPGLGKYDGVMSDANVATGVGGQSKYYMMMVFCGNAIQKHHKT